MKDMKSAISKGGPKTIEGKLIASKNAIKHGFFAQNLLVKGELAEDLEGFRESVYSDLKPEGTMEELLTEKMISTVWRWKRLLRIESQKFDGEEMFDPGNGPVRAFEGDNEHTMQTLVRYEANLERMFYKALHELQRLQGMRLGQPVMAPIAIDLNVEGSKGPEEFGFVL